MRRRPTSPALRGPSFRCVPRAVPPAVLGPLVLAVSALLLLPDGAPAQLLGTGSGPAGTGRPDLGPRGTGAPAVSAVVSTSPFDGDVSVALTRETIVELSSPVDPATVPPDAVRATFSGQPLAGSLVVSGDGRRLTLFHDELLPAASRVTVTVDGTGIFNMQGWEMDADADGVPGGVTTFAYDTVSIAPFPGTAVCGRVFASELDTSGAGQSVNVPLEDVTISVDGAEDTLFAVTDANGDFRLEPAPGGKFFVHIDGATAVAPVGPGEFYPTVGKAWETTPGEELNIGDVFLPLIVEGTMQPVVPGQELTVGFAPTVLADFPELAGTSVTIPADALFFDDLSPGTEAGISPVPPDRLPGPVPEGLEFPMVFTLQAGGATNLDVPAPVTFPNLPDPTTGVPYEPGTTLGLWSFDHDVGRFGVAGSMTVSADGTSITSDPGTGIPAPGWFAPAPGAEARSKVPEKLAAVAKATFDTTTCLHSAKETILDCVSVFLPFDDALACGKQVSAQFVNVSVSCENFNASDCLLALSGAGAKIFKSCIGLVVKNATPMKAIYIAWDGINCVSSLIATATSCFGLDPAGDPLVAGFQEILDDHEADLLRLLDVADALTEPYGAQVWFQGEPDDAAGMDALVDWHAVLEPMLDPASDGGQRLSAAESALLLTAPLPSHLSPADVQAYVDRHNRTVDYWEQGIFTIDDVPAGQSTDFVDRSVYDAKLEQGLSAATNFDLRGFPSVGHAVAESGQEAVARLAELLGGDEPFGERFHVLIRDEDGEPFLRLRTTPSGTLDGVILPANALFDVEWMSPGDFEVARMVFATGPDGTEVEIPPTYFTPSPAPDGDGDGIPDDAEEIVGTDPVLFDSDGDGVGDGAEVLADSDPLDGLAQQTGFLASIDTAGQALDVDAFDDVVAVADGPSGVSIFNVFNGMDPILIAQVDTATDATAVALDKDVVVAATGAGGLAVIEIAVPSEASIVHQLDDAALGGAAAAVAAAGGVAYVGTLSGTVAAVDLATGTLIESLTVGTAVHDVVVSGTVLYAATATTLNAIPLFEGPLAVAGSAVQAGGASLSAGRRRLFVGGGEARLVFNAGYGRFDLSDPLAPVALGNVTTSAAGWKHLVDTGSGLGVAAVGQANNPLFGNHDVELYDLDDPADPQFLTRFETPDVAKAVSLFNGIAYAADRDAGLHAINYLAADAAGVAPVVGFSTNAFAGGVPSGSVMLVQVAVDDDVQVRNVELLVDGTTVQTDGNFPFVFFLRVPAVSAPTGLDLAVRASDTGGNTTTTPEQSFTIVPDTFGPVVAGTAPTAGATVSETAFEQLGVVVDFGESLDPATVDTDSVTLRAAGDDGVLDTGDDVDVLGGLGLVNLDRRLVLGPVAVPLGPVRLRLDALAVTDAAGNLLDGDGDGFGGDDFVADFDVTDQADVFWLPDADGVWDVAANWSTGLLPGATDAVTIDVPAAITVTHATGRSEMLVLDSRETVSLVGGTLSIGFLGQSDAWDQSGGTLSGAGPLFVDGPLAWTGGTMDTGRTVANGPLTLDGVTKTLDGRSLDVAGSASWLGGGLQLTGGAALTVLPGGLLDVATDADVLTGSGTVRNEGTLVRSAGRSGTNVPAVFDNDGVVDVQAGSLRLAGGGSSSGTFAAASGTRIVFGAGTHVLAGGATLDGTGTYEVSGGSLAIDGDLSVEHLELTGGDRAGTGESTVTGHLDWQDGDLDDPGTTTVAAGATATLAGGLVQHTLRGGHVLAIAGDATWTNGTIAGGQGSVLRILPGGLFHDASNDNISPLFGQGFSVDNQGTFRSSTDGQTTSVSAVFDSTGLVEVQAGTLALGGGGTQSGAVAVDAGARLEFTQGLHVLQDGAAFSGAGPVETGLNATVEATGAVTFEHLELIGTLDGTGTATVTGDLVWTKGVMTGAGTTAVAPGATAALAGGSLDLRGGRLLEIAGTASWTAGDLRTGEGATLRVLPGGLVDVTGDGTDVFPTFGAATVDVQGTWRRSAGAGTVAIGVPVDLSGALEVLSGRVELGGGGTATGTLDLSAGAVLEVGDDVWVLGSGATVTGGGLLEVTGGELEVPADVSVPSLAITASGVRRGAGTVTVTDAFLWDAGDLDEAGTTVLGASATATLDGLRKEVRGGHVLAIGGAATWTAGDLSLSDGSVLRILPGGTLSAVTSDDLDNVLATPGSVEVQGTLVVDSTASVFADVPLLNSGTIELVSGELDLEGGLVQTAGELVLAGGGLDLSTTALVDLQGGELRGAGTVELDVRNGAAVRPGDGPGTLAMARDYEQTAGGTLHVELGGPLPGSGHDVLAVSGDATLDGTLAITLAGGFQPQLGDTFEVMTWSSVTGVFATVDGTDLGGGLELQVDVQADRLVLEVVSGS